jgi:hypothetical protein
VEQLQNMMGLRGRQWDCSYSGVLMLSCISLQFEFLTVNSDYYACLILTPAPCASSYMCMYCNVPTSGKTSFGKLLPISGNFLPASQRRPIRGNWVKYPPSFHGWQYIHIYLAYRCWIWKP